MTKTTTNTFLPQLLTRAAQHNKGLKPYLDPNDITFKHLLWMDNKKVDYYFNEDESRLYVFMYMKSEQTIANLRRNSSIEVKHQYTQVMYPDADILGLHIFIKVDEHSIGHLPLLLEANDDFKRGILCYQESKNIIQNQKYHDHLKSKPVTLIFTNIKDSIAFDFDNGLLPNSSDLKIMCMKKDIDDELDLQEEFWQDTFCFSYSLSFSIRKIVESEWERYEQHVIFKELKPSTQLNKYLTDKKVVIKDYTQLNEQSYEIFEEIKDDLIADSDAEDFFGFLEINSDSCYKEFIEEVVQAMNQSITDEEGFDGFKDDEDRVENIFNKLENWIVELKQYESKYYDLLEENEYLRKELASLYDLIEIKVLN